MSNWPLLAGSRAREIAQRPIARDDVYTGWIKRLWRGVDTLHNEDVLARTDHERGPTFRVCAIDILAGATPRSGDEAPVVAIRATVRLNTERLGVSDDGGHCASPPPVKRRSLMGSSFAD